MKKYLVIFFGLLLAACKPETQPPWGSVIAFSTPGPESLPADGYTTLSLIAQIPADADVDKRTIVFTTDVGTFTNGMNTISIVADVNGNAATYIKSATIATATVKATVQTNFVASKTVIFTAPDPNNILTVNPVTDNQPADGVTTTAITGVVNKGLLTSVQNVVFLTDVGSFTNNSNTISVPADQNGQATAYIKNTTAVPAHVTLTITNVTRSLVVNFSKAVPDYMLLSAGPAVTAGTSNSLQINIALKRNIGTPTAGFLFNYTALDSSNNQIGIFSNVTASDNNGLGSLSFSAGNTSYKGIVQVTISLQQYPAVKATVNIQIN